MTLYPKLMENRNVLVQKRSVVVDGNTYECQSFNASVIHDPGEPLDDGNRCVHLYNNGNRYIMRKYIVDPGNANDA